MTENEQIEKYILKPIGIIRSQLQNLEDCPPQESEGAPEAWLEIAPDFLVGLEDIAIGTEMILLTWLHKADRQVLKCHRRNDTTTPPVGVFTTRSPDRPNPIGVHYVRILDIADSGKIKVFPLEALDGTPVIDLKPIFNK